MAKERIGVVGLGYVGLPLAVALAEENDDVLGFDINQSRISELLSGKDRTNEISGERLASSTLKLSDDPGAIADRTMIMVTVPTPVDKNKMPDLSPLHSASRTVGKHLSPGTVVVFESTVYPGVTEDVCGPILEKESGLKRGKDFWLGYSPERINPGDRQHTIDKIIKVVSGENEETLSRVSAVYRTIAKAGVHEAQSIRVAEAAKVIENIQRDINIALMNELSMIFEKMGLRTADVLAASRTKWNFLDFRPGLVGGHCIGVDPYYLTAKAQELGHHPRVILSGREINDDMGGFIARKLIKMLAKNGNGPSKVGILGLTFKENIPDLRNSKVPDIVSELKAYGVYPLIADPMADPEECFHEYGLRMTPFEQIQELDALILAVSHRQYLAMDLDKLLSGLKPGGIIIDIKSSLEPSKIPSGFEYWSV